ncbi:MAG TPA: energy transducer TonB [Rhizomicrobium sp.]|jgi:protein TonB|nr:energy transducer TonB [Rhizomicrobium sp.]
MERPNHLNVGDKSASSKAGSIAIVVGIHIAVIFGLVAALNQGALMKQLQEIKATVDTQKEPPKAPPPPPPDLVKPPPPVAIVPEFTVATAPPPPVTTVAKPPPAPPPKAAVASSDPLRPVMRTHTLPPYPPISVRLNEQGTTLMEVHITTEGSVDDCKVVQTSSSDRLDQAACDYVKTRWRWQPPTNQGTPTAVSTRVSVKWDLRDAK